MIVVAPHPDDELIGCYSLLTAGKVSEVWYVFDHSGDNLKRRRDALVCAKAFGFTPFFLDGTEDLVSLVSTQGESRNLVVPSIHDSHPQHKICNQLARKNAALFYSVDLEYAEAKVVFSEEVYSAKRLHLDLIYRQQKELWASNASYFLFENLVAKDYSVLTTQSYRVDSPDGSLSNVASNVHVKLEDAERFFKPEDLADALIAAGATKFNFSVDNVEYRL